MTVSVLPLTGKGRADLDETVDWTEGERSGDGSGRGRRVDLTYTVPTHRFDTSIRGLCNKSLAYQMEDWSLVSFHQFVCSLYVRIHVVGVRQRHKPQECHAGKDAKFATLKE